VNQYIYGTSVVEHSFNKKSKGKKRGVSPLARKKKKIPSSSSRRRTSAGPIDDDEDVVEKPPANQHDEHDAIPRRIMDKLSEKLPANEHVAIQRRNKKI